MIVDGLLENMPLALTRRDRPEDTGWNFSHSPVRDEQAAIAGLLTVGVEATERVRALYQDSLGVTRGGPIA